MQLRSILLSTSGRTRENFTPSQKQLLVRRFQAKPYLEPGEKEKLAKSLNCSAKRVESWFVDTRWSKRKQGLLCKCTWNFQKVHR